MRQQDTGEKRKWKSRLKYAAGILGLAVTVVMALVLPDLYSRWQDAKTMGEVTLSQRDGIQFLDTEALDISARLKMLGESTSFFFTQGMTSFFNTYYEDQGREEMVEKCRNSLEKWKGTGLLPDGIEEAAQIERDLIASNYYVQIDAGMIPVVVLCFTGDPYLEVIMDADNGFLYYVGYAGAAAEEYCYACLGVDSAWDLNESLTDGSYTLDQVRDTSRYQFAELAGADSQEILYSDFSGIFLNVRLLHEDFTSTAYRTMFEHYDIYDSNMQSENTGLAVMFGSMDWTELAMEMVNLYYGTDDLEVTAYDWVIQWNEMATAYGRDDLMQDETELAVYSESGLSIDGMDWELSEGKEYDINAGEE